MYSMSQNVYIIMTSFVIVISDISLCVSCSNITDVENLHTALLAGYNKDVRPINNQSDILNVGVNPYVRSIQDLDEITGELSFTGALMLQWYDSKMTWTPSDYGNTSGIYISYESVWVPQLIITTTTDESDTMAKKWHKVYYTEAGLATIVFGGRILASCNVDVEKYPFDTQICKVQFSMWGYSSSEVGVIVGWNTINTDLYTGNSVWDVTKTEAQNSISDNWSEFIMVFHLKRKPSFTIINLVAPILFLSFLNVMVFLLVPDSGERVSYSITVLLAVAVFMTIISDVLPPHSDPVPSITYKLMIDMIISVLITMVTILNLRLYHKEEGKPVPRRLKKIFTLLFDGSRNEVNTLEDKKVCNTVEAKDTIEVEDLKKAWESIDNPQHNLEDNITWKDISHMVDYVSFIVFTLAYIFSFIVYVGRVMS